jgi:ribonuclease HI
MAKVSNKQVTIYTDGACKHNPGPGGWAAILICAATEKIITGQEEYTTNNRMELLSVINALNSLKYSCKVDLYTDSQYVKQGITTWLSSWKTKNWRTASGGKVKNQDLWEQLDEAASNHKVDWHWVKAHNGNLFNERVDLLAKQAIVCGK